VEYFVLDEAELGIEYIELGYALDSQNRVTHLNLEESEVQTKHLPLVGKLANLEFLYLNTNKITKIEGLDSLTGLKRKLDLDYNQITDATPLEALLLNQKKAGKPILDISSSLLDNPLQIPPMEVVKEGSEAFLKWVEENR